MGFPGGSDGKASACNAGDLGSIPGSGRSPGGGNGNPHQHSYLKNPIEDPGTLQFRGLQSRTRLSYLTLALSSELSNPYYPIPYYICTYVHLFH